jgi:hypothetical protein
VSTDAKRPRVRRHVMTGSRLRRAIAAFLIPVVAATMVGQLPARPAEAAEWDPAVPSDVKKVKVQPITVKQWEEWTAAAREVTDESLPDDLPEGGAQTVSLAGVTGAKTAAASSTSKVKAGALPVYVAPAPATATGAHPAAAAREATEPVQKIRVEVLTPERTAAEGVDGVVVNVARVDGKATPGQAALTVDYGAFASAFGGDWAGNLQIVDMSTGEALPSTVDVKKQTITATAPLAARSAVTQIAVAAAPRVRAATTRRRP